MAVPTVSYAIPAPTISGTFKGRTWTATSTIVGQTSTATVAGGGNPIYLAQQPRYSGVVGLLMDYGGGDLYLCSGSLTADRASIVTAGHCVTKGGKAPVSTKAFFYDGNPADVPFFVAGGAPGTTAVPISSIHVNPAYTREVIDDHDIAVLRLGGKAPKFATGYDFYTGGDLTSVNFNIAGYGLRSDVGGALGVNLGNGRLRQGDNRYDFRLGDPDFGGFFDGGQNGFFGTAQTTNSYLSDFDSGLSANDASCELSTLGLGLAPSAKYCDLGRGATEVDVAGGDSGGPQFVDGKIASITSFGLSFGTGFGDIDNSLNSSFGEFSGYVPIFNNLGFINGVPEPASWAMMLAGFGFVGAIARRVRATKVAAA